jgi:hypothetical protein
VDIKISNLDGTPARVNRDTGEITVSPEFSRLPDGYQDFILQHEIGHYKMQTTDELLADKYASEHFLGTQKKSGKDSIAVLNTFLDPQNELSQIRIKKQVERVINTNNMSNFTDTMPMPFTMVREVFLKNNLKSNGQTTGLTMQNMPGTPISLETDETANAALNVANNLKTIVSNKQNWIFWLTVLNSVLLIVILIMLNRKS